MNGADVTDEYTYDTHGNLTADVNKGIDIIAYNVLGKVERMEFSNGKIITYTYDAAGIKLAQKLEEGALPPLTTHYVNNFVYENGTLNFFGSPEGRVVNNGGTLEYQYAIADHQGNTRVVFSSVTSSPDALTATFEGDANDNVDEFLNVDVNSVWAHPNANHTPGGIGVIRMNQNYKAGPAKSVRGI